MARRKSFVPIVLVPRLLRRPLHSVAMRRRAPLFACFVLIRATYSTTPIYQSMDAGSIAAPLSLRNFTSTVFAPDTRA